MSRRSGPIGLRGIGLRKIGSQALAARGRAARWLLLAAIGAALAAASAASAQDEDDWDDDGWSAEASGADPAAAPLPGSAPATAWSIRAGVGFVSDPNAFLLNFELPYRFDRFVSAGPMVQVGLHDNKLIVAPTASVSVRVPDLPGTRLDRLHPHVFAGLGFAVIEKDKRQGDNRSVGFLINAGFGIEYDLSQRVSIGSRMLFNFLPERTLEERFFYAWEVGGIRLAF